MLQTSHGQEPATTHAIVVHILVVVTERWLGILALALLHISLQLCQSTCLYPPLLT